MQETGLTLKKFFVVFGIFVYFIVGYTVVGQVLQPVALINLWTPIDAQIPYISFFVLFYVAAYAYIVYPVFLITKTRLLYCAALRYIIVASIAFVVFYFAPNEMQRPPYVEVKSFFDTLLNGVFSVDSRFNTFPSLHVAFSVTSFYLIKLQKPKQIVFALMCTLLIIASTLFTRQHMLADVLGGYVLGEVIRFAIPWVPIEDAHSIGVNEAG